jgi:L-lactate dehydrogenase complex protein LldE
MMKVALFVPCYIDQFYPHVAKATLKLLTRLGFEVAVPEGQTCCGQPLANSGFEHLTSGCSTSFRELFNDFDYVVSPSGSCVLHLKDHVIDHGAGKLRVFELCEFLTDVAQVKSLEAEFPHKVGLHQSCHGLRGLGLASMTELVIPPFSKTEVLLNMVRGINLISLSRKDECCGFGGTFSVMEEAVSVKMGEDRLTDHITHGAEYITANDMSCLMHLDGLLQRRKSGTKVIHIAEILAAGIA